MKTTFWQNLIDSAPTPELAKAMRQVRLMWSDEPEIVERKKVMRRISSEQLQSWADDVLRGPIPKIGRNG